MALATKIIAIRRLQLHVKPIEGSTSPAVTAVGQCPSAFTHGIEVEARRASSNRSDFLRRSFCSRHAFASSSPIHLSKNLGVSFDHRRRPPKPGLRAFVRMRRLDSVFLRWSVRGSNPRPPACKADALPTELTPQESLGANFVAPPQAVGLERFELSTPRLSSVCSNQLSYRPRFCFVEQSPHQANQ